MKKVAVFGSGNGSNFEAIITYFKNKGLLTEVDITCVSDKAESYILKRAQNHGIKELHVPFKQTRDFLDANKFDLIILAGYMRVLPADVVGMATFVNIHPSLLPSFKGLDAIGQAYRYGVKITGVTVHFVTEEVDGGPVLDQKAVVIEDGMTLEELEHKIHLAEHEIYPRVVERVLFAEDFASVKQ